MDKGWTKSELDGSIVSHIFEGRGKEGNFSVIT